jgi:hypothetical protein
VAEVQVVALDSLATLLKHRKYGSQLYDDAKMWASIAAAALPLTGERGRADEQTASKLGAAVARLLADVAAPHTGMATDLWAALKLHNALEPVAQIIDSNDSATRSLGCFCLASLLMDDVEARVKTLQVSHVTQYVPAAVRKHNVEVQRWAISLCRQLSTDRQTAAAMMGNDAVAALLQAIQGYSPREVGDIPLYLAQQVVVNDALHALTSCLKFATDGDDQLRTLAMSQVLTDDGLSTLTQVVPPSICM